MEALTALAIVQNPCEKMTAEIKDQESESCSQGGVAQGRLGGGVWRAGEVSPCGSALPRVRLRETATSCRVSCLQTIEIMDAYLSQLVI